MGFAYHGLFACDKSKAELFCLYTDPFSNFDDPLFNDFTKLLPVQWCSNLVEPQAFFNFNISGQIFVVHIWNQVDGSWMKVHEEDFNKAIVVVKNYCIKITQTLIFELQWQFPNQKVTMALGIVYPQYWLNLIIVEGSFLLHLNVIKSTFCVARKTANGIMVPPLLDSHMLNVQSSCFRLTMSHNVERAMAEHSELNLVTKLWMRINFSHILSEKFSKYNKLAKIVMV